MLMQEIHGLSNTPCTISKSSRVILWAAPLQLTQRSHRLTRDESFCVSFLKTGGQQMERWLPW